MTVNKNRTPLLYLANLILHVNEIRTPNVIHGVHDYTTPSKMHPQLFVHFCSQVFSPFTISAIIIIVTIIIIIGGNVLFRTPKMENHHYHHDHIKIIIITITKIKYNANVCKQKIKEWNSYNYYKRRYCCPKWAVWTMY